MTDTAGELIEGYALGLLDEDESRRAWRVIAMDHRAQRRFESVMHTLDRVDDLITAAEPPPGDAVWRRIRREVGLDGASSATAPEPSSRVTHRWTERLRAGWRAPLAAAAVVSVAVLGIRVVQLDASNRALSEAASAPLAAAVQQAIEAPASKVVSLVGSAADGTAVSVQVVYRPDGTGYLIGDSLPTLDADRTYQLWAIVGDRVISAGVLGADPGIAPFQVVGEVTGLALTDEVAGGVVTSAQPPVALWLSGA